MKHARRRRRAVRRSRRKRVAPETPLGWSALRARAAVVAAVAVWHRRCSAARVSRVRLSRHRAHVADPRIEQRVEQIDDQVHDRDDRAEEQHRAQDHRVVAPGDALDEVAADARHLVDRLDEERAGRRRRRGRCRRRDHRQQRVLERVARRSRPVRRALGPRRAHVVRAQHVEHAGRGCSGPGPPPDRAPARSPGMRILRAEHAVPTAGRHQMELAGQEQDQERGRRRRTASRCRRSRRTSRDSRARCCAGRAPRTPSGMPISDGDRHRDQPELAARPGRSLPMMSATVRERWANDGPKSPCSAFPR